MKINWSKVIFLSKRQVPVSETCWASGVRSIQKHSAILATRKWCPATAEKLKDVSEISVVFCSRILERQSQPKTMRAPSRKSINCIVSNHFFYIICLSHRHPGSPSLEFMCQCNAWNLLDLHVLCHDPLAIQILGWSRRHSRDHMPSIAIHWGSEKPSGQSFSSASRKGHGPWQRIVMIPIGNIW